MIELMVKGFVIGFLIGMAIQLGMIAFNGFKGDE